MLLSLAVCGAVAGPEAAPGTAAGQDADHLQRLFDSLDKDHDGQLRRAELRQYLFGTDSSDAEGSSNKLDAVVSGAIQRLDSPDVGLGVSETELEQHLHTVLQVQSMQRDCAAAAAVCGHQHMDPCRVHAAGCSMHCCSCTAAHALSCRVSLLLTGWRMAWGCRNMQRRSGPTRSR